MVVEWVSPGLTSYHVDDARMCYHIDVKTSDLAVFVDDAPLCKPVDVVDALVVDDYEVSTWCLK